MTDNTIHPRKKECSVTFIPQGIVIDDSSGDKVEDASEVIATFPASSNAHILSESSSFLVGKESEKGSKIFSIEDR